MKTVASSENKKQIKIENMFIYGINIMIGVLDMQTDYALSENNIRLVAM